MKDIFELHATSTMASLQFEMSSGRAIDFGWAVILPPLVLPKPS
jgi:hypothetical protein